MAEKQVETSENATPMYPMKWFTKLAARTAHHKAAWDAGTGNGQAAICLAEYYDKVIATDIDKSQLKQAIKHSRISYKHTPPTMSEDEMVTLIGGDNSIDLIIVAQAIHYFNLTTFYSISKRVLRKQGGLIAIWVYNDLVISPELDVIMKRLVNSTIRYRTSVMTPVYEGCKTLSFPFEGVKGMGSEGKAMILDIPHKFSFKGLIKFLRSWPPVVKAKEEGVEIVSDDVIAEFEEAWGDEDDVKDVFYKAHMIVGKISELEIERRKRCELSYVCPTLKDSNNSAVIASVTAAAFAGLTAFCVYSARKNT